MEGHPPPAVEQSLEVGEQKLRKNIYFGNMPLHCHSIRQLDCLNWPKIEGFESTRDILRVSRKSRSRCLVSGENLEQQGGLCTFE